jgi:putative ABC transport system permease protein
MFDRRWRKMLRDAWLHKSRTLLVMLAVAIGMIGAGSLLDAWALVRRVTAETYVASHPASATLRLDGAVDGAVLEQVRANPAVAAARARRTVFAAAQAGGSRETAELFALDDFESDAVGKLSSERGTWPPRDGEIVLERSSLDFASASLGAPIRLQVGAQTAQSLTVTGIVRDVGLPPGWMDHLVYGYVTPATLAQLGVSSTLDELQIVVRDTTLDRDAVRSIAYDIKATLERDGRHVLGVDVPVPLQHPHAAQMDSLMVTQGAFAVLTLLVVALLIVNLITALLAGQTREIGVMKTLGASAAQLSRMYLVFAAALGALAAAIAVPVSVALGRPYAGMKADMLNFSVAGFAIPWWAIAAQIVVAVVLPVLAAAWPVLRVCRGTVAAALRDSGIACDGASLQVRRRLALPGIGRPLLLSIGNTFRRRQRTWLTILALAAGGSVFLGASNLRSGVEASVDAMFASQRYDLVVRLAEAKPAHDIETSARRVAGVARAQAFATDRASVLHADGNPGNTFTLIGLPPDTPLLAAGVAAGRWLDAHDDKAIAVSRSLLRDEPGLGVGDDVRLAIGSENSAWHIVGIVDTGPQAVAYAPFAALAALHGHERATMLAVALESSTQNRLDTILRLRAELERAGMSVTSSQALSEARRSLEDHLLMVVQFLGMMGWVMIVVGGMGLASTMSIAVLERTREIGVLRAIGARHGAILRIVQAEGLVIALLAWAVSLPLSVPMSLALADAFGKVMFPVPVSTWPEARGTLLWLALVVVVSIAACAWPARRATHVPIARALSYE